MAVPTPETIFTRDILGNYVCNTLTEAMNSGPFDVIIIGGGTFGLALAQDLYFRSKHSPQVQEDGFKPSNYRILVLEAGPFTLAEHVQDFPSLGLGNPGPQPNPPAVPLPATRPELIAQGRDTQPVLEVWGLPWNSAERFGGLAYCLGGRSLYLGGWSPRYLDTEMHTAAVGSITSQNLWPSAVVQDLKVRFFDEAAQQTGVDASNDFINGPLHDFYRKQAFQIYNNIPDAIALAELPNYIVVAGSALQGQLANPPYPGFADSLKLDAPLAVQAQTRAGFFPFNKFSSPPSAIAAARDAFSESGGNDSLKRLMIVPNCHVKRLRTRIYTLATGGVVQEVDRIEVRGRDIGDTFIDLTGTIACSPSRRPMVVLALGAIESARMALVSTSGLLNANQIGRNLMVHVRKNATFIVPLPNDPVLQQQLRDEELSVLLVRCRTNINGTPVHFHFQIAASALPAGASLYLVDTT